MGVDIIFKLWRRGYGNRLHKVCIELIKRHILPGIENYCDLGCGDLTFTKKVVDYVSARRTYCLDINRNDTLNYGSFSFKQCDFNSNRLPCDDDYFDFVTCSNVIEHLHNTDNFLKEIYRILRPAGGCLISTNNISCWTNILSLLFGKQPNAMYASDYLDTGRLFQKDSVRAAPSFMHRRLFSLIALKNVSLYHGFINPVGCYCVFYPFVGIAERLLEKILPIYSAYIVVFVWKEKG